ncbi:hypothetical protein [Caballeronia sp. GAWG1-1]|uniref:hypothetical protein n=1 Tax=Caballeronia sp. GAWG1-1 TaxID=2921742 RepID=UPI0020292F12|nr:hypothetical protein [Caballeronia sp. GAWG1-1]
MTLTGCGNVPRVGHNSLKVSVSAIPALVVQADPQERYFVDYSELQKFWKSTDFTLNTDDNDILQSVNTEASDQTLQIAGATLQSAAQIAGAVFTGGVSVPVVQAAKSKKQNNYVQLSIEQNKTLSPELAEYLRNAKKESSGKKGEPRNAAPKRVKEPLNDTACTDDAFKSWLDVQTQAKALKDSKKTDTPASGVSAASQPADAGITAAANSLVQATKAISATFIIEPKLRRDQFVPNTLDNDNDDLIYREQVDVVDMAGRIAEVGALAQAKYVGKGWVSINEARPHLIGTQIAFELRLRRWSVGDAASDATSTAGVGPGEAMPDGTTRFEGLVVRSPAYGSLKVCVDVCGYDVDHTGIRIVPRRDKTDNNYVMPTSIQKPYQVVADRPFLEQAIVQETSIALPQFGKKIRMPLHNKIGQDGTLQISVASNGSLNLLAFRNNSNVASGISSIGSAGTAYSTAISNKDTAIAARNTALNSGITYSTGLYTLGADQAGVSDQILKSQADCLAQQSTIIKAGGTPKADCD